MPDVTFRDETATGRLTDAFQVAGLPARMTLRELIRLRVREEVACHNADPSRAFTGLVRPRDAVPGGRRFVDWEKQADLAERAFESNGFFVLSADRQLEDLDEEVDLTTDPELTFIKLVPLVGG
ncbi:hypothetical protein [Thermomonospora amylolytica]|uniref:hypothetical protein n=1 Tax=Thermomonospora amylolytica TaxID=1411117 RepID=UPI000E6B7BB5|nr:hypothetical protein [Thermomonospora amylolytica]